MNRLSRACWVFMRCVILKFLHSTIGIRRNKLLKFDFEAV